MAPTTDLPATDLSRTRASTLSAMLIAKTQTPSSWQKQGLLLRFVERTGANTVVFAYQVAADQLAKLNLHTIYNINVSMTTVRNAVFGPRNGIASKFEVHLNKSTTVNKSQEAWPCPHEYKFVPWVQLNQVPDDGHIDLIGRVAHAPRMVSAGSLRKAAVDLENGPYTQTVELLGDHCSTSMRIGDIVAFAGLQVRTYREDKTAQTGLLTFVEVNPAPRESIPSVPTVANGEPRRKALKMVEGTTIPVTHVRKMTMQDQPFATDPTATKHLQLLGHFNNVTAAFFEDDSPVEENERGMQIKWRAALSDQTETIHVTVWTKPFFEIFHLHPSELQDLWAKGVDSEEEREEILDTLNEKLKHTFRIICRVSFWKDVLQVNVNAVELVD